MDKIRFILFVRDLMNFSANNGSFIDINDFILVVEKLLKFLSV